MLTKTLAFISRSVLMVLAGSGCSAAAITGTTELPSPRSGAAPAPNVASVPMPLSGLFDYPVEALTSRASLVRIDDAATCIDLLIRRPVMLPKDEASLPLWVSVEIDGAEVSNRQHLLPSCRPEWACLPPDSALRVFMVEDDVRIRVEAQRVCFERLPRAQRELVLSANPGSGAWRFRFRFTDGPG